MNRRGAIDLVRPVAYWPVRVSALALRGVGAFLESVSTSIKLWGLTDEERDEILFIHTGPGHVDFYAEDAIELGETFGEILILATDHIADEKQTIQYTRRIARTLGQISKVDTYAYRNQVMSHAIEGLARKLNKTIFQLPRKGAS